MLESDGAASPARPPSTDGAPPLDEGAVGGGGGTGGGSSEQTVSVVAVQAVKTTLPAGHDVHDVHAASAEAVQVVDAKVPVGHAVHALQARASRYRPSPHVRQSVAAGPSQVPHVASHVGRTLLMEGTSSRVVYFQPPSASSASTT